MVGVVARGFRNLHLYNPKEQFIGLGKRYDVCALLFRERCMMRKRQLSPLGGFAAQLIEISRDDETKATEQQRRDGLPQQAYCTLSMHCAVTYHEQSACETKN